MPDPTDDVELPQATAVRPTQKFVMFRALAKSLGSTSA